MLVLIENCFQHDEIKQIRDVLHQAQWHDGNHTAGHIAKLRKKNLQLPAQSEAAVQLGNLVLQRLGGLQRFTAAAMPCRIAPPMFNCYQENGTYGNHVDNAIHYVSGTPVKIRSDLSMTVFFSNPDEYEGGELVIEDTYGSHIIKEPAGHAIIYPSSSIHRVNPVTEGRRLAAITWIQSLVRSPSHRVLLYSLDQSIQNLAQSVDSDEEIIRLTGIYHNLLREWSET